MSFAAHGNWCGPGWSAKQWKDAKDLTEEDKQVEAVDALDQACKEHDIGIAEGDPLANKKFFEKAAANGYYGLTLAQFVKVGGPSLQNYLRGGEEVNKEMFRRRESKKQRQEATYQRTLRNARVSTDGINTQDLIEAAIPAIESLKDVDPRNVPLPPDDDAMDQQDDEMREVLLDMQNDPFETPARNTQRGEPTLTREDNPQQVGRNVRDRANNIQPLSNLLNQVDNEMEPVQDVPMAPMSTRSSTTNDNANTRGNRETLVKYNMRAEMGIFTETRTAYLPVTFFLSINNVRRTAPIPLRIRLDWPVNILVGNTLAKQEIVYNGGSYARTRGLSNDMCQSNERANADNLGSLNSIDPGLNKDQLTPFPCTIVGDTAANSTTTLGNRYSSSGTISDTTCIPAYRKWYGKIYEFAHCMETDYKITYFSADQNESFQNMMVFEGMNCISQNNTERIPEDKDLQKCMHWPHLKTHRLGGRTNEKTRRDYVISGTWKDDMQFPMKLVPNEEDVKTWTKNAATDMQDRALTYREELLLLHYSDYDSTHTPAYWNLRVDLRYKVQFRDLSNVVRFLGSGTPATYTTDDCEQYPRVPEIVKATIVTSEL